MNEGYTINGRIHDTMMAAPLLNENEYSYSLNSLGKQFLNEVKDESLLKEAAQVYGVDPKSEMYKLPPEYVGVYAEQDADLTYRLWQILKEGIVEEDITDIYNLESSLLPVLIKMRSKGVLIDTDKAQQVKKKLFSEERKIVKEIKRWYGVEPDLWAAQSLSQVFDRAGLDYPRTPKTNAPSFVANWLEAHDHKLPMAIAKARKLNKARTTFIDKMILEHLVDGRIHGELPPVIVTGKQLATKLGAFVLGVLG